MLLITRVPASLLVLFLLQTSVGLAGTTASSVAMPVRILQELPLVYGQVIGPSHQSMEQENLPPGENELKKSLLSNRCKRLPGNQVPLSAAGRAHPPVILFNPGTDGTGQPYFCSIPGLLYPFHFYW